MKRRSVTRLRGTPATNGYGVAGPLDWTDPDTLVIGGCLVTPAGTTEDRDGRDAVTTGLQLFAPKGADLTDVDRVEVDGKTYEVSGIERWPSPSGALAHVEARLQEVAG